MAVIISGTHKKRVFFDFKSLSSSTMSFALDAFVNARGMGTEISSVSDPPSSAAAVGNGSADSSGLNNGNFMAQPSQMSPPRPTNNLQQNDYYNVLQPVPIMNTSQPTPPPQRPSGPSSLPSSSRYCTFIQDQLSAN